MKFIIHEREKTSIPGVTHYEMQIQRDDGFTFRVATLELQQDEFDAIRAMFLEGVTKFQAKEVEVEFDTKDTRPAYLEGKDDQGGDSISQEG